MRRTFTVLVTLVLFSMVLPGCGEIKQINRVAFVTALGIDQAENNQVEVHVLIAIPGKFSSLSPGPEGGGGSQASPNYVLSETGENLSQAIQKIRLKVARDLDFGHTKLYILSSELARKGLRLQMDALMRRHEFQIMGWMAITEGKALDLINLRPELPESISDYLVDIMSRTGSDTLRIAPIYLYQFFSRGREAGVDPFAPLMKVTNEKHPEVSGTAIFSNYKQVGVLSTDETIYLQILQNEPLQPTIITTKDGSYTLSKYSCKMRFDPAKKNVSIRVNTRIEKIQTNVPKRMTAEDLNGFERSFADKLSQDIANLTKKLQSLKVDPAGFGQKYRLKVGGYINKEEWTNEIFPSLNVEVSVKAKINKRGAIE